MRKSLYCLFSLFLFASHVLVAFSAGAEPARGTIAGAVTDTSQAILPGATVKLDGGKTTATSDGQGQFTIPNVNPGPHTLTVDYVGFKPTTESVTVVAGQVVRENIVMNVASATESILVTAERAHGEAESINETRIADNILNVLPAEVITSLPNKNIADALGRLPGVTLERDEGEGKYVQIRGTEPRLANLTIDGVEVPSPEGGVRQVKLDVIPADLVDSIQINKTLQPDMNGDAIGGSVNLVTKKAGDRPDLTVYGLGGFTPIVNTRSVYEFGGTAGQRFGAQKRLGIIGSGSYDYNGRGIDDIEPVPSVIANTDPFVYDISQIAVRQYLYDRKRWGFGVSADYKLGDNSTLFVHSLYSDFYDYGHRFEYILNTNDDPSTCPTLPCGNVPQFTTEIRNPHYKVGSVAVGGYHVLHSLLLSWQFAAAQATLRNPIGGGESHTIFNYFPPGTDPVNNPPTSNCQYLPQATTNAYLPQFNQACFSEAYNPANLKLNQIQHSDNGKTEQLNLEGTFSVAKNYHVGSHNSTFQAGFYIRNAHKYDDSFEVDYTPNDITAIPASLFVTNFHNSNYYGGHYKYGPGISWEGANAYLAAHPDQFTASTGNYPNSNNFDLVERVTAGYLMDSIDINRFHIVGGVRFEGTSDRTLSFDGTTGGLTFPGSGSYVDVLPSVSLRARLDSANNSALRFVYARGLSRPDPVFLTTATSLDNSTTPPTVTLGNPALKPEHANNIDVLYERYLTPLGLIQAGFFYKSLSSPIVTILSAPQPVPDCPVAACLVSQAKNSGSAYIAGLELGFQQHFTYLPGLLSGLGILANYSYAGSRAHNVNPGSRTDSPALLRQAPNTWNISPTYDKGRLSMRLGLSYNGPNIFAYFFTDGSPGGVKGPFGDQYLFSHLQVDAQGSVYLGKGFTAIVSGLNLNNEVFGFYQGSPHYFIQREYYKPTYSFGLKWDLPHGR
jgi:TonB-dependent receptor